MEENFNKLGIVEKIKHWSKVFGLPVNSEEQLPSEDRIALSLLLIDEEFMEVVEAIDNKDLKEVKDGLGDLLWVTVRMMMECGIDPEEVITEIYKSNMSKADLTQEDAVLTYEKYKKEGIHTYIKKVDNYFITYRSSDNKVLKSHKFINPKL